MHPYCQCQQCMLEWSGGAIPPHTPLPHNYLVFQDLTKKIEILINIVTELSQRLKQLEGTK